MTEDGGRTTDERPLRMTKDEFFYSVVRRPSSVLRRLFRLPVRILEPQPAYALWAESYPPHAHNPLMFAEQAALEALLAPLTATNALDLGTGSGRWLPSLARTGASRVVGLDFSFPMLKQNPSASHLVCADATSLPLPDESFDLLLASLMVGHLRDLAGWVDEVRRVLRRGGHLLYSDFHPLGVAAGWQRTFKTAEGQSFAVRHYPRSIASQRAALIGNGFKVQAIHEPGLEGQTGPTVESFRQRWGERPVVVVVHATKR
jgi:malonyl-CoA O-methyltransferase